MAALVYALVWFFTTFYGFVIMITAKRLKREGKMNLALWVMFTPALLVLSVFDVGAQFSIGLLAGTPRELTLSTRMKRYRTKGGNRWQLFLANTLCGKLLNPVDPDGHC